jgi:hypothetical protein
MGSFVLRTYNYSRYPTLWGFLMRSILLISALLFHAVTHASPYVAIIIDDIGYSPFSAKRIAEMDYKLTGAILPEAPSSMKAIDMLIAADKEIMLHLPMQGRAGEAQEVNVLHQAMDETEFKGALRRFMALMPYVAGLNNHQGSVLTRKQESMNWLMQELGDIEDFYFIDSRTTGGSKAIDAAEAYQVPYAVRDIFLDHERTEHFVEQQFLKMVALAKKQGHAMAIGHPYYETIKVLKRLLPMLEKEGIELVFASQYIARQATMAHKTLDETPNHGESGPENAPSEVQSSAITQTHIQ